MRTHFQPLSSASCHQTRLGQAVDRPGSAFTSLCANSLLPISNAEANSPNFSIVPQCHSFLDFLVEDFQNFFMAPLVCPVLHSIQLEFHFHKENSGIKELWYSILSMHPCTLLNHGQNHHLAVILHMKSTFFLSSGL